MADILTRRLEAVQTRVRALPGDPMAARRDFERQQAELAAWEEFQRWHLSAWRDHATGELVCPAVRANPCCHKGSSSNPILECDGCLVCRPCVDPDCLECRPREVFERMPLEQLRAESHRDKKLDALMLEKWGEPRQSVYRSTTRQALLDVCKERGLL